MLRDPAQLPDIVHNSVRNDDMVLCLINNLVFKDVFAKRAFGRFGKILIAVVGRPIMKHLDSMPDEVGCANSLNIFDHRRGVVLLLMERVTQGEQQQ